VSIDFASIRSRVDIVALIESRGVKLRKSGAQYVGPCPFHDDRTPSFYVHPERGFYCHGCGAHGDALDLLQLVGFTFEEALAQLDAAPKPIPQRRSAAPALPARDAAALWDRLPEHDDAGEAYLGGRRLRHRDPEILRSNVGMSGDRWLDARAHEGFRCAFAVRNPRGVVQTISTRRVTAGEPKTLALAGVGTTGAAICSPAIFQLAAGDPEFARDEVLILEGGTDWLGATAYFMEAIADQDIAPIWPLGVIGATNAAGVVEAFAAVIRWRVLLVGLDSDPAGERAALAAAAAARRVGARNVLRIRPPAGAKDWAEAKPS
jgi:hypothetical protein